MDRLYTQQHFVRLLGTVDTAKRVSEMFEESLDLYPRWGEEAACNATSA
jgi:hypothetical protein